MDDDVITVKHSGRSTTGFFFQAVKVAILISSKPFTTAEESSWK